MLDRAMAAIVAGAAAGAAAVLAVFAAGFALYALIAPTLGEAGAAAIVALSAALIVAIIAWVAVARARKREREAALAREEAMEQLPYDLGAIARDRPLLTLGLTAVSSLVAARHPALMRQLSALVGRVLRR